MKAAVFSLALLCLTDIAAAQSLGQLPGTSYPEQRLITVTGKNGAPVILQQRGPNIYDQAGKPIGTIIESTNTIKPLPGTTLPDGITPNARIQELVPAIPRPPQGTTSHPAVPPGAPTYRR